MYYIFYECYKLSSITFSNKFNTLNVETMEQMFYKCSGLEQNICHVILEIDVHTLAAFNKAAKGLFSLISLSQRSILSALFNVPEKNVAQTLKDAVIV